MPRPPKPRIIKPNLVWKFRAATKTKPARWEPFYVIMVSGRQKALRLDWQGDAKRLDSLYWSARSGKAKPQEHRYTWERLAREWRGDPREVERLAASTRNQYNRTLERILEKNARKDITKVTRQGLRKKHADMADTPREANRYLQTVSKLWNYAVRELDWPLGPNPAAGIRHYEARSEYEPWPAWMLRHVDDAPEPVRTAVKLMLGTGQRPGAAFAMEWAHFRGEWMEVLDEKTDTRFEAYCPDSLRAFLATRPKSGAHVLARNLTEPLGYDGVEKAFRRWRERLGDKARPFTLHGLRKSAIIELAEAGNSDAEIQAVTNQSMEMINFYRRKASRKRLSKAAQMRREHDKGR